MAAASAEVKSSAITLGQGVYVFYKGDEEPLEERIDHLARDIFNQWQHQLYTGEIDAESRYEDLCKRLHDLDPEMQALFIPQTLFELVFHELMVKEHVDGICDSKRLPFRFGIYTRFREAKDPIEDLILDVIERGHSFGKKFVEASLFCMHRNKDFTLSEEEQALFDSFFDDETKSITNPEGLCKFIASLRDRIIAASRESERIPSLFLYRHYFGHPEQKAYGYYNDEVTGAELHNEHAYQAFRIVSLELLHRIRVVVGKTALTLEDYLAIADTSLDVIKKMPSDSRCYATVCMGNDRNRIGAVGSLIGILPELDDSFDDRVVNICRKAIGVECSEMAVQNKIFYRGTSWKSDHVSTLPRHPTSMQSLSFGNFLIAGLAEDRTASPISYMKKRKQAIAYPVPFSHLKHTMYLGQTDIVKAAFSVHEWWHARTKIGHDTERYQGVCKLSLDDPPTAEVLEEFRSDWSTEALTLYFDDAKSRAINLVASGTN